MTETSDSGPVSTKLQRVAELARKMPDRALVTLAHHIDLDFLREAYRRTRKDGAVGVDRMTAYEYEAQLDQRLAALLERLKSGTYRAPAVRRVHIPKGDGTKTRPIGIPTLEDKILQRAVAMVVEAIYEPEFKDSSYGFRPGRSAHQALEVLWKGLMEVNGGVVIDVDVQAFFDSIDHTVLKGFLDRRMRDGVLRRVIHKWLKAGVLDEGQRSYPEAGTPQGGVISPLLANVYLHEVLDRWFEEDVKPRLEAPAFLVRYADDFVLVFASTRDAERVMAVLSKRFAKHALTIHPDKTRVLKFHRPPPDHDGKGGPSFNFLGFTHYWGRARSGKWVVQRKTAAQRLNRALRTMAQWCRANRHEPLTEQHQILRRKLTGYYGYYGITGNSRALQEYAARVEAVWHRWLNRRSQRRQLTWPRFKQLLRRVVPLPKPVAVHSVLRRAVRP